MGGGADFDADGKVTYSNADGSLGDGAYLPFVPQEGYVYTLSAMIDTRISPLRNNSNDWMALGLREPMPPRTSVFTMIPVGWIFRAASIGR